MFLACFVQSRTLMFAEGAVACSFGDDVTGAACHKDAKMRGNSRKPNLIPLLYRWFVPVKGPYHRAVHDRIGKSGGAVETVCG